MNQTGTFLCFSARRHTSSVSAISFAMISLGAVILCAPATAVAKGTCPAGQLISGDTDGHCCWPGQAWKKSSSRCVGVPKCPKGTTVEGEGCTGSVVGAKPESVGAAAPASCPTGMTLIRGGTLPGSGEIATFCLDRNEVTAGAMQDCIDDGTCTPVNTGGSCNGDSKFWRNHPANCLDWKQAARYCSAGGKRLPSEKEWEWAARGRDRASVYPWGDVLPEEEELRQTVCWRQTRTCAVGSHRGGATPEGIDDMAGNVAEWTSSGQGGSRVIRGGSYFGSTALLAVAARQEIADDTRKSYIGLRCALTIAASASDKSPAGAPRKKK